MTFFSVYIIYHLFLFQSGNSRISPVSSPTNPGSPNYHQQQQTGVNSDLQPSTLTQQLQRLHLQQCQAAAAAAAASSSPSPGSYPHPRASPPSYTQHEIITPTPGVVPGTVPAGVGSSMAQLIGYAQPHQRNSPPPNFQNLQMIEEDDIYDSAESTPRDKSGDEHATCPSPTRYDPQQIGELQRPPLARPQISITDTQGHVIPVASNTDYMVTEEDSATAVSEVDSVDASSSHHYVDCTVAPPTSSPSSSPHHHRYTAPSAMINHYPNLNLANIPHEGQNTPNMGADVSSCHGNPLTDLYTSQMNSFSSGLNQDQLVHINQTWLLRHGKPQSQHNVDDYTALLHSHVIGGNKSRSLPGYVGSHQIHHPQQYNTEQNIDSSPSHTQIMTSQPHSHHHSVLTNNKNSFPRYHDNVSHSSSPPLPSVRGSLDTQNSVNLVNGLGADVSHNLCFALSQDQTSKIQTIADIMKRIKDTLDERKATLDYKHNNNCFHLQSCGVVLEMEVCRGVSENGLRFRKIAGDPCCYHKLCTDLVAGLNL